MTAETTLRLANDCKNIVAIKEASGNFTQIDDIIKNKPDNFDVISGDDGITFPLITLGAVGVISVIGSVLFVAFGQTIGLVAELDNTNWVNYVIYSGATVGLVQVSYTALLKTFKAVVEKLKGKYANPTIDEDKLSDEIVETIEEKVTEAVSDAIKTTTSKKK
jgi:hypothetical protein